MSFSCDFGSALLKKYGWKEGQGLGKAQAGITEAIKPGLKLDSAGLGFDHSKQFKNHWWDQAFNKAAKNIHINTEESGQVTVKHKEKRKSLKCSSTVILEDSEPYKGFVKSAVLHGNTEVQNDTKHYVDTSSDSDSDDDDLFKHLTTGELLNKCGGLTAHKGARHGLTMSAKLNRIDEQERKFKCDKELSTTDLTDEETNKKRKRKKSKNANLENEIIETPKKKKKHKKDKDNTISNDESHIFNITKNKKEKTCTPELDISVYKSEENLTDMLKKKKKKKRKQEEK